MNKRKQDIKNRKKAIITGSNGSIGNAISRELSGNGYQILGIDIGDNNECNQLEKYLSVDLEIFAKNREYANNVIKNISMWLDDDSLTLLVNNAAIQILESIDSLTRESWSKTQKVNLDAPLFLIRDLLPFFSKLESSIINISSIHAHLTKPKFISYSTSKAALSALTRALAIELGDRIRINAIEPAAIDTPMLRSGLDKQSFHELELFHPQRRIGTPEEIASLVLAITQGELRFLHGSCIDFSGAISSRLHDPE